MAQNVFGPYRLEELIGRGASSTIYRATDTDHGGRSIALKIVAPHLSADPAFRDRFRRDAGALSALREPHVVPVHRFGDIDGALYLDMRLVRGRSLAEVLREGPLDPTRARRIAEQVDSALEALRSGGLGEQGLDPADVLLSGGPGRGEFVQLVGLGLGHQRHIAPRTSSAAQLLGSREPPAERPPRRRWWPVAAIVSTAVLVAAAVTMTVGGGAPAELPLAPGQVAVVRSADKDITSIATTTLDGRPVLVGVDVDGVVRTWDLGTGEAAADPFTGVPGELAATEIGGRPVVAVRGRDQLVRVYDLARGVQLGDPRGAPGPPANSGIRRPPRPIVVAQAGNRPVLIGLDRTAAKVAHAPQLGLRSYPLPEGPVGPISVADGESYTLPAETTLDDVPVVVVAASKDTASTVAPTGIRAIDVATGTSVGTPSAALPGGINALAVAERDGVPVVVTGGDDNRIRLCDLRSGTLLGQPLVGHTAPVRSVAVVRSGSRTVLISVAFATDRVEQAETRFWDLATGAPIGPTLVGHPTAGQQLVTGEVEGDAVIATNKAGRVTVWNVAELIEKGTS